MRARAADQSGYVERDGVRIYYEASGSGPATILVLPTWSVLDASHGRFQVADLSRRYRVVTFDPRGNGRSDRPQDRAAYAGAEFVQDAVAVLDATGTDAAVVVACSVAANWLLGLAAEHPDRVLGAIASGTGLPLAPGYDRPEVGPFDQPYRSADGWAKFNAEYWRTQYEDFLRFFFSQVWNEPHSEQLIDTSVACGMGTTPETLIQTIGGNLTADQAKELLGRTQCPWLVIHGERDDLQPHARAVALAEAANGSLVTLWGAGHCSGNRDPVRFNLLVREFVEEVRPWTPRVRAWARARSRVRRVLMVPGAGPEKLARDLAIVAALRARRPDLRVEWLAPEPAGAQLVARGEALHRASAELASRAGAAQDTATAEDAFMTWRSSDELHFVDFMVLNDLVADEPVDLVVADGAWGIDHHLHENPEMKQFAFAWLTDFVGWIPEPDADDRRRYLMADANAEMIEQVERYPRIRDAAFFVGEVDDLPEIPFGPELPPVREWARDRFAFVGPGSNDADPTSSAVQRVVDRLAELV